MYDNIKDHLRYLVDNRNYFFRATAKADAERYLQRKVTFEGISEAELQALEAKFNFPFPEDFKNYLRTFGRSCGALFCEGYNIRISEFENYQKYFADFIQKSHDPEAQIFVFEEHQGYAFSYFCKNKAGKVTVCLGNEEETPMVTYDSFDELLEAKVKELEQVHELSKTMDGHIIVIRDGSVQRHYDNHPEGLKPQEIGDIFLEDPIQDPVIIMMNKEFGNLE